MKHVIALLLAVVMLLSAFALAEAPAVEAAPEEAFRDQLMGLLADFDPTEGEQAALSVELSGQEVASLLIRGAENLVDLTVSLPTEGAGDVQAQFTPEEAYLAAAGSVMGLRYEDLPAVAQAAAQAILAAQGVSLDPDAVAALDTDALKALFQLLAQTTVMKHVTMSGAGGDMILNYAASGSELIGDLCDVAEQVLSDEKYRPLLEQIWAVIESAGAESEIPALDDVIAMWPEAKASLLAVETDFSLTGEVRVDDGGERIAATAEIGVPSHLILVDFAMNADSGKGKLTMDTRLTERLSTETEEGTTVQDYAVRVTGSLIARGSGALWSFNVDYPYPMGRFRTLLLNPRRRNLILNMNGSHLDNAGRVTVDVNTGWNTYDAELYYELDEDGVAADVTVIDGRGKETVLKLDVDEGELKAFSATHAYSREYIMRKYMDDSLATVIFSVAYDGEQLIVVQDGVTVRCAGEMVSDHEYLVTLTPEGEHLNDTTPAYVRVTREGEEGDWLLRAVVIDPTGSEYLCATLAVSPAEPAVPLSDAEGLMMLTPELVKQLIGMMVSE
ncbi:MAG: hypothetical protein IJ048_07275 [Clostridia bacterium]|nr:hypothetical protein [Clostridia bacterium]